MYVCNQNEIIIKSFVYMMMMKKNYKKMQFQRFILIIQQKIMQPNFYSGNSDKQNRDIMYNNKIQKSFKFKNDLLNRSAFEIDEILSRHLNFINLLKDHSPIRSPPNKIYLSPNKKRSITNKAIKQTRKSSNKLIWNELYQKGVEMRKKIQDKHKLQQNKIDQQCTFKPILRGKSQRFIVNNNCNFLERNNIWIQNKIVKKVREKEELDNLELKECTFSPVINKNTKNLLSKKMKTEQAIPSKKHTKANLHQNESKVQKIRYEQAKAKIREQLQKILFI